LQLSAWSFSAASRRFKEFVGRGGLPRDENPELFPDYYPSPTNSWRAQKVLGPWLANMPKRPLNDGPLFTPALERAHAALCIGRPGGGLRRHRHQARSTRCRRCLKHLPAFERNEGILGILSLMFWSLMFAVNFKYLTFVMRADNRGEGGVFRAARTLPIRKA